MKTIVKQLLDKRTENFDAMKFVKWLDENRTVLLNLERNQTENAYDAGSSLNTENFDEYFKLTFDN